MRKTKLMPAPGTPPLALRGAAGRPTSGERRGPGVARLGQARWARKERRASTASLTPRPQGWKRARWKIFSSS
eukprot:4711463-Pyramimonas_sp.AAC.1